ncbi:hypothetical protein BLNAU_14166 [Blattamonas nauphoetae]|uniref:Uncharacterized protein n=1 Tax=Blattamonas nauphoetae TaxID=2049346 RepID=A0ABQ9XHF8_9EUKA|nr:hypothetical protein BLNAU_14166 [Blattamonas nauphoetae]
MFSLDVDDEFPRNASSPTFSFYSPLFGDDSLDSFSSINSPSNDEFDSSPSRTPSPLCHETSPPLQLPYVYSPSSINSPVTKSLSSEPLNAMHTQPLALPLLPSFLKLPEFPCLASNGSVQRPGKLRASCEYLILSDGTSLTLNPKTSCVSYHSHAKAIHLSIKGATSWQPSDHHLQSFVHWRLISPKPAKVHTVLSSSKTRTEVFQMVQSVEFTCTDDRASFHNAPTQILLHIKPSTDQVLHSSSNGIFHAINQSLGYSRAFSPTQPFWLVLNCKHTTMMELKEKCRELIHLSNSSCD